MLHIAASLGYLHDETAGCSTSQRLSMSLPSLRHPDGDGDVDGDDDGDDGDTAYQHMQGSTMSCLVGSSSFDIRKPLSQRPMPCLRRGDDDRCKVIIIMFHRFPIIKGNTSYISKVWLINKSDITWGMKKHIFQDFQSRNLA